MTQICPDCNEEWPDTSNYCGMCRAKLPNAAPWLTDYKKARRFFKRLTEEEFSEFFRACFANPKFKDRLLARIIERAVNENAPGAPDKAYFRDEIFRILAEELLGEYEKGTDYPGR
jgi:predicted amidophosphoribosyltransferase